MEYLGVFAFILVLAYYELPSKVHKLSKRVLNLEKGKVQKEVGGMSEIIKGLVGERCSLKSSSGVMNYVGTVLAVDDEWIKLSIVDKKNESIVVKRIEDIKEISVIGK